MTDDRTGELYDRALIREVLLKQSQYLDAARMDLMREVWAEDCRTDFGPDRGGVLVGRDAFLERIGPGLKAFNWTFHLLGESVIDLDGDRAFAVTSVLAWHELTSGERSWVGSTYHDELRRIDGRWLIWSRKTVVSGVDGPLAGVAWLRLERNVDPLQHSASRSAGLAGLHDKTDEED
jgi:hypothetical protein